jgi:hypothetical protein
MYNTILGLEHRIAVLGNKDPIANAKIINKLKRKLRKLKSED